MLTKNESFVCCFAFDVFKNSEETGEKNKKNGRHAFCRRLRCVIVVVVAFLLPFIAN